MEGLQLVSIGALPEGVLQHLARFLESFVPGGCGVLPDFVDPQAAFDLQRGQVDCRRLFPALDGIANRQQTRILGVADVDLFSAIFTFVFGESRLGGAAAMMSLHRLRPEAYGLPRDDNLMHLRAEREALHEVGHLLGLVHCRRPDCVMRFSGSVEEVDLKESRFCPDCVAQSRIQQLATPRGRDGA